MPFAGEAASAATTVDVFPRPLPSLHELRGVLFDIDGTLTDSDPLHFLAFREILSEVGFNGGEPIDEAFFRVRISGRHNPEIARDLFPDWSEQQRVAFYEDKEQRFRKLASSVLRPLPGLLDLLDWLEARGCRKVAVTNAPRANAELMLRALNVEHRFKALVLGEECARAKPFPDPYLRGLELLGLPAQNVMVCEDSPAGVSAGVAAGIAVAAVTTGQSADALRAAGASVVLPDFTYLLPLLQQQRRE